MSGLWRLGLAMLCAVATAVPAGAQPYTAADLDDAFERSSLVIRASRHACHKFDVWLARSRPQQMRGLMFVRDLLPDTGMLFLYGDARPVSMWMKNTYISLDILFIRADGTVSSIARDTEPLSLRSVASAEPVSFVLELAAGVTASLGIEPGDTMMWSEG